MPFITLAEGNGREVLYWAADRKEPADPLDNCPEIQPKERLKLLRVINIFLQTGDFPRNPEKFKSVEGQNDLFEIKAHQLRLLGTFLDKKTFCVALCVRKKKDKHSKSTLPRAQALKALMKKEWEHEERKEAHRQ